MSSRALDGIDISHHQSGLDLANVHADFVIIKATEGVGYTDPKFRDFAEEAKFLGRLRGFYHFARADLNNTPDREADWFLSVVGPQLDGETILVLDWEAGSIKYGPKWAKGWLDRVKTKTGITPLIYLSVSVTREHDWAATAAQYPLWVAAYGRNAPTAYKTTQPPTVKHWSGPVIFQYGSQGRLDGYTGDIDLNNAYVDVAGWKKLADGKGTSVMAGMVSPVQGYVSSEYGNRSGSFHAGIDIAGGGKSRPVFAAFAGTLSDIVRGRKRYQSATVGKVVAPARSGDGGRVHNPDGEQQVYIHTLFLPGLKDGQKVKAGQLLGHTNLSGNTTGYHCHFEIWNKHSRTRNPRVDFNYFGIKPGSKPVGTSNPKPAPKPKPKPVKPPKSAPPLGVQAALKQAGYSPTTAGVQAYQRANGLYPDGVWGGVTQKYWEWVKRVQSKLNNWKSTRRLGLLRVDGDRGRVTKRAEKAAQGPAANRKILGTSKASLYKGLGAGSKPPMRG